MELKLVRFLFFIVQVLLLIHLTTAREEEIQLNVDLNIDRSNYVDPFDMLNYDPRLTEKKMTYPTKKLRVQCLQVKTDLKVNLLKIRNILNVMMSLLNHQGHLLLFLN